MKHSYYYDRIKAWYDSGVYTNKQVRQMCEKEKITPEEYMEITGEPYEE